MAAILLVTHKNEYSQWLQSYWSPLKNIPSGCHPIWPNGGSRCETVEDQAADHPNSNCVP
jgi:hypothetical protein